MADSTTIVAGKVTVDTGQSAASVKELKDQIKQLKTEFEGAKAGSKQQTDAYAKLKDAQDQLKKSTKELGDSAKDTSSHFKNIKEGISSVPGPLKTASEGVTSLGTAFKALLANPVVLVITAIVAALAFLYKSFTNTAEGGRKMEQVFAGIKAAAGAVLDAIFDLGGAIIKFFSGDFKGAFDQATKAINGVVDAAVGAYNQMSKLTEQAQKLEKLQAQNDLDQANRQAKLADLRAKANDDTIPNAKRIQALKELKDESEKNAKDDIQLAKDVAENKIAQLSIGKDAADKNFVAIKKIQADQKRVETENSNELKAINKQLTAAEKTEQAERTAAAKEASEKRKALAEQEYAFNTQLLKIQHENTLAGIQDEYAKEKKALEFKIADEKAVIQKQFTDGKLNKKQFAALNAEIDTEATLQTQALYGKHYADLIKQDDDYQKQLVANKKKADEDAAAAEAKRIDDEKKKLELVRDTTDTVLSDPKASFDAKQEALDAEQAQFQLAFDNKIITEHEYNVEVKQLAEARRQIHEAELQQTLATASAIGDAFGSLSQLVGKQTAAGKAFAIAQATISTITGAVQSFTSLSAIPIVGPALGIVAAAAALAAGYANVKKIVSVQVPGQSTGGVSLPSASAPVIPSAPLSPVQASTKLDADSINQIGQNVHPIQAYVVEQQGAAATNRAARLEGNSRLGG